MTRYEQELRKLFDASGLMDRPQYSGRVCVSMRKAPLRRPDSPLHFLWETRKALSG